MTRGRWIETQGDEIVLLTEQGPLFVAAQNPDPAAVGDIVEVHEGEIRVLTPNRSAGPHGPKTLRLSEHVLNPRRRHGTRTRARVEALIREFFASREFLETRTPMIVPSPGMEPHIRPFEVRQLAGGARAGFIPTSPEFAMKRLLAGGLERIFQICPAFRDEPPSVTHQPEFTMLEWYRAYAGYEDIMRDTEELFEFVARKLFGKPELTYQGRTVSVQAPWPRLRVRDLFREHAGIDLVACASRDALAAECARLGFPPSSEISESWDDLYFKLWLNVIEPQLPADHAVFVTRYPASQAALSVIDEDLDGSRWARRFEVYAGGLELGNAFEELTDPTEQRKRFEADMRLRESVYGAEFPASPIDEDFLAALAEGMPPAGGIAVGVDRMIMLFADEPEIGYTLWLPYEAEASAGSP